MQETNLYTMIIPPMTKAMGALSKILDKAAAHATAKATERRPAGRRERAAEEGGQGENSSRTESAAPENKRVSRHHQAGTGHRARGRAGNASLLEGQTPLGIRLRDGILDAQFLLPLRDRILHPPRKRHRNRQERLHRRTAS